MSTLTNDLFAIDALLCLQSRDGVELTLNDIFYEPRARLPPNLQAQKDGEDYFPVHRTTRVSLPAYFSDLKPVEQQPVQENVNEVKEIVKVKEIKIKKAIVKKPVKVIKIAKIKEPKIKEQKIEKIKAIKEIKLNEKRTKSVAVTDTEYLNDSGTYIFQQSFVGRVVIKIWKQLFLRNAEFKLTEEGREWASIQVYPEGGKRINGKHWRYDQARTTEHLQMVIRSSCINNKSVLDKDIRVLDFSVNYFTECKLYRAFDLQVRCTNHPDEPETRHMVNSRKASKDDEMEGQVEGLKRRANADILLINDQVFQFHREMSLILGHDMGVEQVPDQSYIKAAVRIMICRHSDEDLCAASHLRWIDEPAGTILAAWKEIQNIGKIIATYTSLAYKSKSFGLTVGSFANLDNFIGPAYNGQEREPEKLADLLLPVLGDINDIPEFI